MRQIDMRIGASSRRAAWACRLLPASVLLSPLAAAADASVDWRLPAECSSVPEVAATAAELERRELRRPAEASAVIAVARVSDTQLEARVSVRSAGREREQVLRDASCLALARAAALVVSLALHPEAAPARAPAPKPAQRERAAPRAEPPARLPTTGGTAAQGVSPADVSPSPVSAPRVDAEREAEDTAIDAARTPEKREELLEGTPPPPPAAAEPEVARDEPQPRTREPPAAPEPDAVDQPEPDLAEDTAPPPKRLDVYAGVAAGLSRGMTPQLAPTAALTLALTYGLACAGLRFGYAPSQRARLMPPETAGGDVALAHAAIEAGLRPRGLGLEFPLMAGVEGGFFVSRGAGVPERETRVLDWLAASLSAGLTHSWNDRVRLGLRIEGLLALRRPSFALELGEPQPSVFYRPGPLGARVYLGLDLHLW